MASIRIGDREIGDGHPCFVIAEAGSNHDGKLDQAKELIDAASDAGADAVKFQTFEAERLYNEFTNKDTVELLSGIELHREWHEELMNHAKHRKIVFLTSVFDEESADFVDGLGAPAFKIASAELNHIPLIRYVATKMKPMLLSTGMANESEIRDAVDAAHATGNASVALLHCISQYPTEVDELNLRAMLTLKTEFGCPVGFSDHTTIAGAATAAVAMGANIIEKHLTTSRKLAGPDHSYATEPDEFGKMVLGIREVERMLGDGSLEPSGRDVVTRLQRRAIYAAEDIPKGALLERGLLMIVRPAPEGAIPPKRFETIIGRATKRALRKGDLLTEEVVDL
ncbi:MAG: N-acetylneuraminate synthase family protein [Candidatus Thermoplasmatota archaeon]|nr:N-acetylneuraminate synthase family protein [Candidatus Thermoplasmatota archaeon]